MAGVVRKEAAGGGSLLSCNSRELGGVTTGGVDRSVWWEGSGQWQLAVLQW